LDVDDLVIGSGLSALGTVLGLLTHADRRIAVYAGPAVGRFAYYDARATVPCAYMGEGGLGSHWHGVIPTGLRGRVGQCDAASFASLFARFYPHTDIAARLGDAAVFVPWRAIRPGPELRRLARRVGPERLRLVNDDVAELRLGERGVSISARSGPCHARRGWLAAGVLHSPGLAGPISPGAVRGVVDDHAFCYVGQVEGHTLPRVRWTRDGALFPARYDSADTALYTLRPAAFAFRELDVGIEQRALFGLPTGNALAKIARRMSPGLLTEAFYNRAGLFGNTRVHSVYAQVRVPDAYDTSAAAGALTARPAAIRAATDAARAHQPCDGLRPSRKLDTFVPGIHLHHSLDQAALARAGVNVPGSPLQIVDASVLADIGPDHHSFKMMVSACERARRSGAA
jgi:hypothetical protein